MRHRWWQSPALPESLSRLPTVSSGVTGTDPWLIDSLSDAQRAYRDAGLTEREQLVIEAVTRGESLAALARELATTRQSLQNSKLRALAKLERAGEADRRRRAEMSELN